MVTKAQTKNATTVPSLPTSSPEPTPADTSQSLQDWLDSLDDVQMFFISLVMQKRISLRRDVIPTRNGDAHVIKLAIPVSLEEESAPDKVIRTAQFMINGRNVNHTRVWQNGNFLELTYWEPLTSAPSVRTPVPLSPSTT